MTILNGKQITEDPQFSFTLLEETGQMVHTWNLIPGLAASDFARGIEAFARTCADMRPRLAVIDAEALDPESPAVAWLRGQRPAGTTEDYQTWWARIIVPIYNGAGVDALVVGTGDPNAPGELTDLPPAVAFRVVYLPSTKEALDWRPV